MFILINTKTKEKFLLTSEETSIGSYTNSNIRVTSVKDAMFIVRIEKSRAVFYRKVGIVGINNKAVGSKVLEDGDQISIGTDKYLFMVEEDESQIKTNVSPPYLFLEGENNKENESFIKSLIALNTFSQKVSSILDFGTLLNVIIELAISTLKTEKGFILLHDNNDFESLSIKSAINMEKELEDIDKFNHHVSNRVYNLLKNEKSHIVDKFSNREYPGIKFFIAARLKARNSVIGYICLINKNDSDKFNERDRYLIESLATQAAISVDNANLYEKVKNETDLRNDLQRYLPRDVVSKVIASQINLSLIGELQECSILFADICGFTSISENLNPKEIVKLLNYYLTIMTKVIFSFNGSVDKFIGDGIMAVFGAPVSNPNHALEATLAAVEMKNQIESLREKFLQDFGISDFSIRIGINTGPAVYGNVGSPQRMDFTVIGDTVNTASRMEKSAPPGSILISKNTYDKVREYINAKEWEPISLKGKRQLIKVYEIIDQEKISAISKSGTNSVRMYSRVQAKTFVSIIKNGFRSNGLIRDISIGGVSIGTVGSYSPQDLITMTFKLSNNMTFRNVKGIVKHIERSMFEAINIGVEFVDFPEDKMKELIAFIEAETSK